MAELARAAIRRIIRANHPPDGLPWRMMVGERGWEYHDR
jgi:hypothetical protein